jgi:serine/threonine protein kinase
VPGISIEYDQWRAGRLRIVRELGRGGMGVVYEAEQISIGRPVALKVLPFASMLDERRLARFRNEVRAAGQLHHTNIVPIYAVGSDRGVHFYAMQLVAGQTLAQVVEQLRGGKDARCSMLDAGLRETSSIQKPASSIQHRASSIDTARAALSTLRISGSAAYFRTVAELAVQAAKALEHAHSCGVVHRDIKPSNLMVDERGCLWLTDFGLASVESGSDLTMTGDLLGTLRYMSPEQTLGSGVVDHRTISIRWALRSTSFTLFAFEPPTTSDCCDGSNVSQCFAKDRPGHSHDQNDRP